ncbi:hypothetical protein DA718_14605 [Klebsiella huaxiensis]|nr:hypothetical protein DA718_14605 [Klebsiella huaxiensis]
MLRDNESISSIKIGSTALLKVAIQGYLNAHLEQKTYVFNTVNKAGSRLWLLITRDSHHFST